MQFLYLIFRKGDNVKKILFSVSLLLSVCMLSSCKILSKSSDQNGVEDSSEIDDSKETTEIITTYTEAYSKVMHSCFGVRSIISQSSYAIGSCVCIKQDDNYSYFITNRHVIEAADTTKESENVSVYFGDGIFYTATILACTTYSERIANQADDLAILRITTPSTNSIKINPVEISTSVISKGTAVISVGCPLSLTNYNTLTEGIVSKVLTSQDLYMHTATINPGNSGGGLFTLDGKLVGINVSGDYKLATEEGYTYNTVDDMYNAITYEHLESFLSDKDFSL